MSKRHADSTPDEKAPKRRKLSADEVLVEAARNGDTTAVRVGLEKLSPDTDSKTVSFDAVHEACRGNEDEDLARLLPHYVDRTNGFGILLSECIHADHTACTEVLLQHWKSCSDNTRVCLEVDVDELLLTCLHLKRVEVLAMLLKEHKLDLNGRRIKPLCVAAHLGDLASAELLVASGAGLEVHSENDASCARPLYIAACRGDADVVQFLVAKGADCEHCVDGMTALDAAVAGHHLACVKALLSGGAVGKPVDEEAALVLRAVLAGAEDVLHFALVEAARNGDTTAVRAGLEKLSPDTVSKTVAFDSVHEACRGNHDECLALLLPYVETTQMGFGMLLSECIHADHTACTEVLLQHWKSVCSNVAFVPHGQEDKKDRSCPAMWADPAVCQVLIDAGADIETKDDMGRSPLHWSCRSGALDVVKMLVKAGADVCVTDNHFSCLSLAACHGHTETVRYLVGLKDVDLRHSAVNGFTALHWACREGRQPLEVIQVLIDGGADMEAKTRGGRSPLLLSISCGNLDVAKVLVKAGAYVSVTDNNGSTCLIRAAVYGHTETVRYLVGLPEVDVHHKANDGSTALLSIARRIGGQNHAVVVEVLIDAGADIEAKNNKGRSPLIESSCCGRLDVVEVLLKAGADVCVADHEGHTCLTLAAHFGHTKTVRYLAAFPEVDMNQRGRRGQTALHMAVHHIHADVVEVLIDAGADIEAKDENGRSPLHRASEKGAIAIVQLLIKAGAGVRVTDNNGATCLILAAYCGRIETVRYLVRLPEVDMNQRGSKGRTALHMAVHHIHADVVEVLIDAGADIEAKDENGHSPLHRASEKGAIAIVQMLIKAWASCGAGSSRSIV